MLRGKQFCESRRIPNSHHVCVSSLIKSNTNYFFSKRFTSSLEQGMKLVADELVLNSLKSPSETHIVMGLSGGVDSAVGALILKKLGYNVSGIHTRSWQEDDQCAGKEDEKSAEQVANQLGIPLKKVDLVREYWTDVFEGFLDDIKAGLTPNPDIGCNVHIKFKSMKFHAFKSFENSTHLATGHYARIRYNSKNTFLLRGVDNIKDQSYFLAGLNSSLLDRVIFPNGVLTKGLVRKIAKEENLENAEKESSKGICFIGKRKSFADWVAEFMECPDGRFVSVTGEHMRTSKYAGLYTIGQGAKLPGMSAPFFVFDKDMIENKVFVCHETDTLLWSDNLVAQNLNWIVHLPNLEPGVSLQCEMRIRHTQQPEPCEISLIQNISQIILRRNLPASDILNNPLIYPLLRVDFKNQQRGVAPGQLVAFYKGDICLGSGMIAPCFVK